LAPCASAGAADPEIQNQGWQAEMFDPHKNSSIEHVHLFRAVSCSTLSLPGVNGLELQKRVAAERRDMPIIFITGYSDVPKTVQAMKVGLSNS
jgi:FixJ family two-component response regulator